MTLDEFYERAWKTAADIGGHMGEFRDLAARSRRIIEIGVGDGNSTSAWLIGARDSGAEVWSVDLVPTDRARQLETICPEWTYVVGDSVEMEPQAPYDADVLFIDSDHSYTTTKAELVAYAKHVRPGGIILLHDTDGTHPGVNQALDELYEGWENNPFCSGLGKVQL